LTMHIPADYVYNVEIVDNVKDNVYTWPDLYRSVYSMAHIFPLV
jgi:hypothetical protein